MKKYILFTTLICITYLDLSGREYQVVKDTVKQELRPDSSVICLLDNKIIPYKEAVQKMATGEIHWVYGTNIPRDAIRYFGIAGIKGLYLFATPKEEKGEENEE